MKFSISIEFAVFIAFSSFKTRRKCGRQNDRRPFRRDKGTLTGTHRSNHVFPSRNLVKKDWERFGIVPLPVMPNLRKVTFSM
jgi:hypothetical protein